jgi:hypothetical protein
MLYQYSLHLSHTKGVEYTPMFARDDDFTFSALEMAAPVRHNPVAALGFGAVKISTFPTIANDRVEGNSGFGRQDVYRLEKQAVRIQHVNTVRQAMLLLDSISGRT